MKQEYSMSEMADDKAVIYFYLMFDRVTDFFRQEIETIIIITLAAAVCAAAGRYWLVPQWGARQQASRNIKELRAAVSADRGSYSDAAAGANTRLSRKLTGLTSGASQPDNLSALLQMLITKADAADIQFVKIEPEGEIKGDDFIKYPVLLEMSTTYHSLARFVSSLEALPDQVSVDRVGMTAHGTAVDAALRVTCYLQSK
jgi:Tfp pilus assembly protein PilO